MGQELVFIAQSTQRGVHGVLPPLHTRNSRPEIPHEEPPVSFFYDIFCLEHPYYLIRSTFPARNVFAPE